MGLDYQQQRAVINANAKTKLSIAMIDEHRKIIEDKAERIVKLEEENARLKLIISELREESQLEFNI